MAKRKKAKKKIKKKTKDEDSHKELIIKTFPFFSCFTERNYGKSKIYFLRQKIIK